MIDPSRRQGEVRRSGRCTMLVSVAMQPTSIRRAELGLHRRRMASTALFALDDPSPMQHSKARARREEDFERVKSHMAAAVRVGLGARHQLDRTATHDVIAPFGRHDAP